MNRIILYWSCQLVGWGFYLGFGLLIVGFGRLDVLTWLPVMLIKTITLVFLTHQFRNYIIKSNLINQSIRRITLISILTVVSIATTVNILASGLMVFPFEIFTWQDYNVKILFYYILNESFILGVWVAIYFTVAYKRQTGIREIEKWRLEVAVRESQLESLKAQINPHFIFNSLNNIRSLIFENPEQAGDMITHLSDLLRYSMKLSDSGKETIKNELEVVEDFLKLQSIHLEDRLHYFIEVDQKMLDINVPSMSIQMLVENGVKHGILENPNGGEISIKIYSENKQAIIEIKNNGVIKEKDGKTNIGIKNSTERLRLMYGDSAKFTLEQTNNNLVTAKFSVPLEYESNNN